VRALILSDIHSNLEALEAVVADAQRRGGFDAVWCLGDTVGYGPDPSPCLDLLRPSVEAVLGLTASSSPSPGGQGNPRAKGLGRHVLRMVAGNHDLAAVGKLEVAEFNIAAATAARWTTGQLSAEQADFLARLPLVITEGLFTLVHGSLRAPLWEYLLEPEAAQGTLERLTTNFCLVGHSHIPFICRENGGFPRFVEFTEDEVYSLGQERWIINPGAVGQPRDGDPRPSYAIYHSQPATVERHRVTYDIPRTQEKMRRAGLPQPEILRLDHGV
jgi:diadenosine tetraphosphatase ApaH/serine/threonine PP2A family protein phosphatase